MFASAIDSRFSNNEVCVIPSELEEVSVSKSHRGMETYCAIWLDNDRNLRQIKENGEVEIRVERAEFLRALNKRHQDYVADTRKALAFCFSRRALYVLVGEMAEHDKALAAKSGREFCNTFNELERAIESVELRLIVSKSTVDRINHTDPAVMARAEINNRGSVRLERLDLEKRIKVKYALKVNAAVELVNHGWHMVLA
jgi:hypothetical protein